jgi:hypothetical protein
LVGRHRFICVAKSRRLSLDVVEKLADTRMHCLSLRGGDSDTNPHRVRRDPHLDQISLGRWDAVYAFLRGITTRCRRARRALLPSGRPSH